MKFLNFLVKKWRVTAILLGITIATVVGVVFVKASTVTIMVDKSTIAFTGTNMMEVIKATANLSLDPGVSGGTYSWTVEDPQVATVTANEGSGTVLSKGAGKTTVNVSYSLSDGTTDTKRSQSQARCKATLRPDIFSLRIPRSGCRVQCRVRVPLQYKKC